MGQPFTSESGKCFSVKFGPQRENKRPHQEKEVVELYSKAMRVVELTQKFKVNKSTIGTILKKKGLGEGDNQDGQRIGQEVALHEGERLPVVWISERQMKAEPTSLELICQKAQVI